MCQSKADGGRRCETALSRPGYSEMNRAYLAAPNREKVRQAFHDRVVRYAATGSGQRQVLDDADRIAASDPEQAAWLSSCAREGRVRSQARDAAGQVQQCGSPPPPTPPRVPVEVEEFLASEWGRDVAELPQMDSHQLAGLCEDINGRYGVWLHVNGEPDVLLVDYVSRPDGDLPADQPHTVVVADGHVHDLTFGQFDEGAPVLVSMPVEQWEQSWQRLGERSIEEFADDYLEEDYLGFSVAPGWQCVECGAELTARRATGLCWDCFQTEFTAEAQLMGIPDGQAQVWVMEQFEADALEDEISDAAYLEYESGYSASGYASGSGTKYGYDEDYGALPGVDWGSYKQPGRKPGHSSMSQAGWGFGSGGRLPTVPYVNPHKKATEEAKSTGKVVRRAMGPANSGDGYVYLPQDDGEVLRVWGLHGASGVLIRNTDTDGTERFFLAQRGGSVDGGNGTWAVPGGALDPGESAEQGALREFREEIKTTDVELSVHDHHVDQVHAEWSYTTVLAEAPTQFTAPEKLDWETKAVGWFTREEIAELPLHPAFAKSWPHLLARLDNDAS